MSQIPTYISKYCHSSLCVTAAIGIRAEVRQISHFLVDLPLVLPGCCIKLPSLS